MWPLAYQQVPALTRVFFYSGRNDEVTVRRGSTVYPTRAIDGNLGLYLRWEIKTLYI